MRGRLRHQLLTIWLGSILGVLLLVGFVLTILMDDFRRREAEREIASATSQLRHELVSSASHLVRHSDLLKARRDIRSTVNLVDRYQDVTNYQPLVFDGEKRHLAISLADRLNSAELYFAAIYDGAGRPIAFAQWVDGDAVAGFHSVAAGSEVLLGDSDDGWQPVAAPPLLKTGDWTETRAESDVTFRSLNGQLVLETTASIERDLPNAPSRTIGYVHTARMIGQGFLASLGNRAGVDLAISIDGNQVGMLPAISIPDPDRLPDIAASGCPCGWLDVPGMTVGASRLMLDEGGVAVIMVGSSNDEAAAIGRFYRTAAVMVLLGVAGVVAPGGFLLLNRSIVTPISRLLSGLEALRNGRAVRLADQFREDEFGTLAKGFDAMAASIADREEELRSTIDQLARTNAELERFAIVAAHDLQEPLRMVASYTQLLKRRYEGRLDKDADEFIGYAVEGAERMKTLIQSVLDYSSVENDRAPYTDVDCGAVVQAALHVFMPAIEDTGAKIRVHSLPIVRGNAVQLGQVFQNLLSNALKFRRGRPEIDIGARPDGGEWLFAVKDNGIGIGAEYMPQLFSLFRRLHTQQEYPGSGLGLAIARRIVERHGGRMWVESQEGVGTTILFTLPASDVASHP